MQNEMENNDNPIIQGLEALLKSEDVLESFSSRGFSQFKDSFSRSMDQSRDSGFAFNPNISFRHLPSLNSSIQNQSTESGFIGESFEAPFGFKPVVNNVSFDGCFIEDDSSTNLPEDLGSKFKSIWGGAPGTGILSSAISHGGDIGKGATPTNPQDAYQMVKYTLMLRKSWNTISCISKLRSQLTKKPSDLEYLGELNLTSLLDAFKTELTEIRQDLSYSLKLCSIVNDIQSSLELMSSNTFAAMDWKLLKLLKRLTGTLFLALYSQCILLNSRSTPSEESFRSEKRFQIWNSLL